MNKRHSSLAVVLTAIVFLVGVAAVALIGQPKNQSPAPQGSNPLNGEIVVDVATCATMGYGMRIPGGSEQVLVSGANGHNCSLQMTIKVADQLRTYFCDFPTTYGKVLLASNAPDPDRYLRASIIQLKAEDLPKYCHS